MINTHIKVRTQDTEVKNSLSESLGHKPGCINLIYIELFIGI